ncbi:mechanosensitive ion channel [Anaplasmataceae bacterium AB001_6]|nr:mechanosensitive ion channel [Anaplasmataceae bacterium AB001_6]
MINNIFNTFQGLIISFCIITPLTMFIAFIVLNRIVKHKSKKTHPISYEAVNKLKLPILATLAIWIPLKSIEMLYQHDDDTLLMTIREIAFITLFAAYTTALITIAANNLKDKIKNRYSVDLILINKILCTAIYVVSLLMIVHALNINIASILTFGGIGGIAIGFAAKDLIANLFGFLVIVYDQPFKIGDKISINDMNIIGKVSNIGLRMTQIINTDKIPIYVPNSVFTTSVINNQSRMLGNKISKKFSLYFDKDKDIKSTINQIKTKIFSHQKVKKDLPHYLNVINISNCTTELVLNCYISDIGYYEKLEFMEEVLIFIREIVKDMDVKIIDSPIQIYKNVIDIKDII